MVSTTQIRIDLIRQFITTLEANNRQDAESYLTEDFMCSGWTPKALHRGPFLHVIAGLKEGIPDFSFNLRDLREQNEQLIVGTIQITGTQIDSFILPDLSLPPIPQTDNKISLPSEEAMFEIADGQISEMIIQPVEDGDIHGLLHQLGIDIRVIQ
jgi:hypothetical protein